jgi:hypothetical protein
VRFFRETVWIEIILDIKILFKTVVKVLRSDGINATNEATIEPFNGE